MDGQREIVTPDSFVFQSSRGNRVGGQWYTDHFFEALFEAGITRSRRPKPSDPDYVRPFHDMRHTAITNMAATGKIGSVALMGIAGHRDAKVTRQYMHLAGVVFSDEAEALEARLNGG
jgi:integrase